MSNEQLIYETDKQTNENANIPITADVEPIKIDEQIEKICQKYDIFPDFLKAYKMIYETYHGIKDVKLSVIDDIDRIGEKKVCFEINIKGSSIHHVVKDEKKFFDLLVKEIPEIKNQYFRFTFRFVEP